MSSGSDFDDKRSGSAFDKSSVSRHLRAHSLALQLGMLVLFYRVDLPLLLGCLWAIYLGKLDRATRNRHAHAIVPGQDTRRCDLIEHRWHPRKLDHRIQHGRAHSQVLICTKKKLFLHCTTRLPPIAFEETLSAARAAPRHPTDRPLRGTRQSRHAGAQSAVPAARPPP